MEIHDIVFSQAVEEPRRKKEIVPVSVKKLSANELELFARTLSSLLEGGVPILRALDSLKKVASSTGLKNLLAVIQEDIRRGAGLSESLERSGAVPDYFYQTVYGGEVSGRVPMVLAELALYLGKEEALKRSVRDALVYPAFILAVGFVTLGFLTGFVLPKLGAIYDQFDTELPFMTTIILGFSKAFLPVTIILSAAVTFFVASLKKKGKIALIIYEAPFFGDFFKRFIRVRFSRLLSLLLDSGVPVLEAITVVEKTSSDSFIQKDVAFLKQSLATGNGFSSGLDKIGWMDSISKMLIITGEETGRLGVSFFQIARDTEAELEARIHLVVKLLEPTLILFMGLAVGFVVIATVLPIFDMSGVVR